MGIRLVGNNYLEWLRNLYAVLESRKNIFVLQEQYPPVDQAEARARWMVADSEVRGLIVESMIHTWQEHMGCLETAMEMVNYLDLLFLSQLTLAQRSKIGVLQCSNGSTSGEKPNLIDAISFVLQRKKQIKKMGLHNLANKVKRKYIVG